MKEGRDIVHSVWDRVGEGIHGGTYVASPWEGPPRVAPESGGGGGGGGWHM